MYDPRQRQYGHLGQPSGQAWPDPFFPSPAQRAATRQREHDTYRDYHPFPDRGTYMQDDEADLNALQRRNFLISQLGREQASHSHEHQAPSNMRHSGMPTLP